MEAGRGSAFACAARVVVVVVAHPLRDPEASR
jgi:hypothetical protein